jgi:hypothetical protein
MLLVFFVVVIIAGLSVGLLQEGVAARNSILNHKDNFRALEIAESGLVRAEMELRALVDLDGGGLGSAEGAYANGFYVVTALDDPISPDRWILRAEGEHGMSVRRIEVGVRRRSGATFADALFSVEDLPLSNTVSDAYDSRLGTYASQVGNADAAGTFAESGGNVGSNLDIELDGSSVWVRGNAIPGPGHQAILSGGPTVTGDMAPRNFLVDLNPPPFGEFEAAMNDNDNNSLQGGGNGNRVRYNSANYTLDVAGNTTLNLGAGTYFFKELKVKGGSVLNVTGPVKIYVTRSIDIGAGTHLVAARPGDVQLFAHPYVLPAGGAAITETTVKISGGSNITWAMNAPGATLDIGGGNHFYGAAIGKRVELQGNNAFHYDKALGETVGSSTATLERLYWREVNPPRR